MFHDDPRTHRFGTDMDPLKEVGGRVDRMWDSGTRQVRGRYGGQVHTYERVALANADTHRNRNSEQVVVSLIWKRIEHVAS